MGYDYAGGFKMHVRGVIYYENESCREGPRDMTLQYKDGGLNIVQTY